MFLTPLRTVHARMRVIWIHAAAISWSPLLRWRTVSIASKKCVLALANVRFEAATARNGAKKIIGASANWRFISPLDMERFGGNQPYFIDAVVREVVEILNCIDPDPNLHHCLSG